MLWLSVSRMSLFHFKALARRINKGIKVAAGQDRFGKPISLLEGDVFTTKVSGQDTNGDLYIYESIRLKKGGVPLHYHYEQDEWWYVLEGEFLIKVGDEIYTVKAGDFVWPIGWYQLKTVNCSKRARQAFCSRNRTGVV